MSKNKKKPPEVKYQILLKLNKGVSIKTLSRNFNISTQTIRNWEKKSDSRSLIRKEGSCTKSLVNFEEFEKLEEIFKENPDKSSRKLRPLIKNKPNVSLSIRTIKSYQKQFNWIPVSS